MHLNRNIDIFYLIIRTIATILSYIAGGYISHKFNNQSPYLGSMLAAISTVIIIGSPDFGKSVDLGWRRIFASFLGAVIACIYLLFFKFSIISMALPIALITLISMFFSFQGNGKIATIVMIWIFVRAEISDISPLLNGLFRFIESTLGVLIGIAGVFILRMKDKIIHKK